MNDISRNRLYLIRHGENPANINKVFSSGLVDQSLTEKGRLQAHQAATYFAKLDVSEGGWAKGSVFSSPLKRATETADIIADRLGLKVEVIENLREIDVGDMEHKPATSADWAFYRKVVSDWYDGVNETGFPGGENYVALWTRIKKGLLTLTKDVGGQHVLIVGHGGIMTTTMKDLCPDVDVSWLRNALWDNCAVTEIDLLREGDRLQGTLLEWNRHDFLSGEAAELIPGVPHDQPDSSELS